MKPLRMINPGSLLLIALILATSCNTRLSCNDCLDLGDPIYLQFRDSNGNDLLSDQVVDPLTLDDIEIISADEVNTFFDQSYDEDLDAVALYPGFEESILLDFGEDYQPLTLEFTIKKEESEDCCGKRPKIKSIYVNGVQVTKSEILVLTLDSID